MILKYLFTWNIYLFKILQYIKSEKCEKGRRKKKTIKEKSKNKEKTDKKLNEKGERRKVKIKKET